VRFDLDETARTFHPEQRSLEDLIRLRPFAEWIVVGHISTIVKQQGRMRLAVTSCPIAYALLEARLLGTVYFVHASGAEAAHMRKRNKRPPSHKIVLKLPDLDQAKSTVLNSLSSSHSRRNYKFAIEQFITWYCSEPRLALNRTVVLRFRLYLESLGLAAGTVNQRLAAVRRLAYEAADSGLLSPELAAGIRRVKGAKQLGARTGNWLTQDQARLLLEKADGEDLRSLRDLAMISVLVGCGLRRAELSALTVEDLQIRQGHWAIVDLVGKGGHVRTVPVPVWVKDAVDRWRESAKVTVGRIFRPVSRHGTPWGEGISENVIWYVVRRCADRMWSRFSSFLVMCPY
jgi:integrase